MNTVKVLKEISLCKGMDEKILNVLANIAEVASVPAETVIFMEGMPADAMFIIASGKVEVIKDTSNKQELVMGELSNGDVLGILSIFVGGKRNVTVRAKEPVELITITKDSFDKLVKNNIHAAYQLLINATKYVVDILNSPEGLKGMIQ
jgi:CRP-like cAMP-binding protein